MFRLDESRVTVLLHQLDDVFLRFEEDLATKPPPVTKTTNIFLSLSLPAGIVQLLDDFRSNCIVDVHFLRRVRRQMLSGTDKSDVQSIVSADGRKRRTGRRFLPSV